MDLLLAQQRAYGTPIDYAVIFGDFIFIMLFGSCFGRCSKSTRDFFFSGQRFSCWLIMMSIVATGVGTHSFMNPARGSRRRAQDTCTPQAAAR